MENDNSQAPTQPAAKDSTIFREKLYPAIYPTEKEARGYEPPAERSQNQESYSSSGDDKDDKPISIYAELNHHPYILKALDLGTEALRISSCKKEAEAIEEFILDRIKDLKLDDNEESYSRVLNKYLKKIGVTKGDYEYDPYSALSNIYKHIAIDKKLLAIQKEQDGLNNDRLDFNHHRPTWPHIFSHSHHREEGRPQIKEAPACPPKTHRRSFYLILGRKKKKGNLIVLRSCPLKQTFSRPSESVKNQSSNTTNVFLVFLPSSITSLTIQWQVSFGGSGGKFSKRLCLESKSRSP